MDHTASDPTAAARPEHLDPATFAFYRTCMKALNEAKCDYLVGGAYAFARYTGIERHTKDFDIFVRQEHGGIDREPSCNVGIRKRIESDRYRLE